MPALTIDEETFARLAKRAATLNMTVEQFIAPLLALAAEGSVSPTPKPVNIDTWKKNFDAWMAEVQSRADRYPPGFVMDDSRECIYKECGE